MSRRNKVYYRIDTRMDDRDGLRLEYHVSSKRSEVMALNNMCQALILEHCDAKRVAIKVAHWHSEAKALEMIPA